MCWMCIACPLDTQVIYLVLALASCPDICPCLCFFSHQCLCRICVLLAVKLTKVQEARKDQHKQSKPSSAAGAAKMRQQQLPSSQGLHSRAPAQPPSTAAQAASTGSFPGFSVLPSQKVATAAPAGTGKPSSRRIGARPSCPPESSILQPALSQEPELPCYSSASKAHPCHTLLLCTLVVSLVYAHAVCCTQPAFSTLSIRSAADTPPSCTVVHIVGAHHLLRCRERYGESRRKGEPLRHWEYGPA